MSSIEAQLGALSIGQAGKADDVSWQDAITAFRPDAAWEKRNLVLVQLAVLAKRPGSDGKIKISWEKIESLTSALTLFLCSEEAQSAIAAVRFLAALFLIAPEEAHELLFGQDRLATIVLHAVANDVETLYVLAFVELMNNAANNSTTCKRLIERANEEEHQSRKIVELDAKHAKNTGSAVDCMVGYLEIAELRNPLVTTLLSKVALLSALAMHKLTHISQEQKFASAMKDNDGNEDNTAEDKLLLELCRRHITLGQAREVQSFKEFTFPVAIDDTIADEYARLCQVAAIEGLSYLTLLPRYRDRIASSPAIIGALCVHAQNPKLAISRSVFPSRKPGSGTNARPSTYEFDKALTSASRVSAPDTALQFGIASILHNLMSYPEAKSKEAEQMQKLRQMANASTNTGDTNNDDTMKVEHIEKRISSIIGAKGVAALTAIVMGLKFDKSGEASLGIRGTVSRALLAATTRQDKKQRGLIIQQGGAKALQALADINPFAIKEARKPDFHAAQALAQLCITENPSLVASQPLELVPILAMLYLHDDATKLQTFEASLALTNLASLSPEIANRIAKAGFPRKMLANDDLKFRGQGSETDTTKQICVADTLHERIVYEDNEMSQRASIELLCNLLVVDDVFKKWSGETEDEKFVGKGMSANDSKTLKDLTLLLALCAPGGQDNKTGESCLKARLAASAVLATLCSSASTCSKLFKAETRLLAKLGQLLEPSVRAQEPRIVELKDEGESAHNSSGHDDDVALHEQDLQSDPLGSQHARWQLAVRGLAAIECLVEYARYLKSQQRTQDFASATEALTGAGLLDAVQTLVTKEVEQVKEKGSKTYMPTVKALQERGLRQALGVLQMWQSIL